MKKYRSLTFLIAMAVVLLYSLACSNQSTSAPPAPAAPPQAMFLSKYSSEDRTGSGTDSSGVPGETGYNDRKIVRTGSMTIVVNDIGKSQSEISDLAIQYKGYVVSSNQRADKEEPNGYISIRIPAGTFNEVLQKLRSMALKVVYENTNSQDVTEQYMDLEAQLHNYQATEAQYLELLKKADTVKDILEVQRELSNVRASIERVKGRIQYLERTSDMSLIEISLQKSKPIGQSTWDITGIFKSAVDGLIAVGKVIVSILIWLLVFSPLWIIILIIILVIRKRRKSKAAANHVK
jgi:hypothetical protein